MSEAQFSLIFRGKAVDDGSIPVAELAPALLALNDLLNSSNETLNKDRAVVAVNVRATRQGCFQVDLSMIMSMMDNLLTYAHDHKDQISSANDLADLVFKMGGIAGSPIVGLFALLKALKGRKPEEVHSQAGHTELQIDGKTLQVDDRTIALAENPKVRQNAKRLVDVLQKNGIDSIAARQSDGEELTIEKKDIPSFALPAPNAQEDEILLDETRIMNLQIVSLSFKEENKWRMTDGGEPFNVSIDDPDFIKQIDNGEAVFSKNDHLKCNVREVQELKNGVLKKELTVVKVLKHISADRQLRLI